MPKLQFDRHVAHQPEAMFKLVSDLDAYPRFIPNCKSMVVKKDNGAPGDVRFARMTLSFGPITQGYTSRVTFDPVALTVDAKATDGPFQYLISQWRFEPEASGTKVHFEVDFLTIGQYLQPTRKHHPVIRYVEPDEFKSFEVIGRTKGFLLVSSSPLTRSSHHAGEDFAKLKAARLAQHPTV